MDRNRVVEAAQKVYRYMVESRSEDWGMGIDHWDWNPGAGIIAIEYYARKLDVEHALDYVVEWIQRNAAQSERIHVVNSLAPFAVFPKLYAKTGDKAYLTKAIEIGRWIVNEAPRTREGAYEHTVTESASFTEQVWADTIFMAVLFLARLAKQTGNVDFANEALEQVLIHLRLLQDEETNVLFHGWNCIEKSHMSAARWTRANAWICISIPEIIAEVKELVSIPEEIAERYSRMVNGLLHFQNQNGLWHTVMNQPDFYEEVSGSAGIACGILRGIQEDILPEECKAKALHTLGAVLPWIREDGHVNGVSGGTPVMESIAAYNGIEIIPTLYGQGLVLMLLTTILAEEG